MNDATTLEAAVLWRRLDTFGADAARLFRHRTGWRLSGTAVFLQEKDPARLDYDVELNVDWTTRRGFVHGFVGDSIVDCRFERDAAGWKLNGAAAPGLRHLEDLDFGFTPATNLPYLRRANLAIGCTVDRAVAWWEPGAPGLQELPQRYERRTEHSYWCESPTGPYEALLEFAPGGFVRTYPNLWTLESAG